MAARECPMCAATMRRVTREAPDRTAAGPESPPPTYDEWECPDCDYFEDAGDVEE